MENILDRAEEIIRAFIICNCDGYCSECPFGNFSTEEYCNELNGEILSLIRALQSEFAKVTAERDAAVKDMTSMAKNDKHDGWSCLFCKNSTGLCL